MKFNKKNKKFLIVGLVILALLFYFFVWKRDTSPSNFESGNYSAQIESTGNSLVTHFKTGNAVATFTLPNTRAKKSVAGDTVIYDIGQGVQFKYENIAENNTEGLKEIIILNDRNSPNEFNFNFKLDNVAKFEEGSDTTWHFYNKAGDEIFTIPARIMWDKSGARSTDVKMKIEESDDGYKMKLTADPDWLGRPGRVYPVEIDPTILVAK